MSSNDEVTKRENSVPISTPLCEIKTFTLNDSVLNASSFKNPVENKESTTSWFSMGTFGATLMGKDSDNTLSGDASPRWPTFWLQNAKEKTLSTLESMKKDINELSDTVQNEASTIASVAANSVKSQAHFLQQQLSHQLSFPSNESDKLPETEQTPESDNNEKVSPTSSTQELFAPSKWMRLFLESVQKFGIEDTTCDEAECIEELHGDLLPTRKTNLDHYQLLQIQNDERTYLHAPVQNIDLYREWLLDFKISEYNGEINILLGYNPKLRKIYSRLVPSKVDNNTFWNRYFFKIHMQELDKEIAFRGKCKETEGNNVNNEGDETWSMCSSTNNDIQDLDEEVSTFNENDKDSEKDDVRLERDELKTPQQLDIIPSDDNEAGWEKCDTEDGTEISEQSKKNEPGE